MLRVAAVVACLALLYTPVAVAETTCFTCKNRSCEDAESLGFTNCNSGQECGPAGCLEWCVAGPNKCAEAVPIDPPDQLRIAGAMHCQPVPPPPVEAPGACMTRNGHAIGGCLLGSA